MDENYKDIEERLSKEFESIEVPEDALEKMKLGIEKAEEYKKGRIIDVMEEKRRNKKRWPAVAVAAAAILFALPNVNESVSHAMGNIPIAGPLFKLMTIREFNYENKGYEIDVKVPNISIESHEGINTEADKELEDKVRENVDKVNKDMDSIVSKLVEEVKREESENNEAGNHLVQIDSNILADTDRYLSLVVHIYESEASGYERDRYYVIDKRDGKEISLKELFSKGTDYKKLINEDLIKQMEKRMKDDDNVHYFLHDEITDANFKGIKDDQQFYLDNDGKLHICFDEYEIAPGYMGVQDFIINCKIEI